MINIDVKENQGVTVIYLNGEFYSDGVEKTERIFKEQAARKPRVIAFNCSGLTNVDSSALGLLVKLFKNTGRYDVEMAIYDISPEIINVFKVTKLDAFFKVLSKSEFESRYLPGS